MEFQKNFRGRAAEKQDQKDLLNLPLSYVFLYSDVFTMKGKIQLK